MKTVSVHTEAFLDVERGGLHLRDEVRNFEVVEARQKTRKADGAKKNSVVFEDRNGDAGDLRIPFAAADVEPVLMDAGDVLALLNGEGVENLSGGAEAERNNLSFFDVIPGQPRAVHPIEANARIAALNVKGRAFPGLGDKVGQDRTNVGSEPEVFPELRAQAPQGGSKVIETAFIPHQVTEAFKRDGEPQDRRLVEVAAARKFLERQASSAARKDVEKRQRPFNGIDASSGIFGPCLGPEYIHLVHKMCTSPLFPSFLKKTPFFEKPRQRHLP